MFYVPSPPRQWCKLAFKLQVIESGDDFVNSSATKSRLRKATSFRCECNYRQRFQFYVLIYTSFRPAGGTFTVEVADNQAFTTLSYGGKFISNWPDGAKHPDFVRTTLPIIFFSFSFLSFLFLTF